MITQNEINEFLAAVNAMLNAYQEKMGYKFGACVTAQPGKKYIRIVKHDVFDGVARESGSAFCFVEMETGAIFKPAGWKTPAKHARGNIANGATNVGPYGPAYL